MRLDIRYPTPECFEYQVIDNNTGLPIKDVIMADDEKQEYLVYSNYPWERTKLITGANISFRRYK